MEHVGLKRDHLLVLGNADETFTVIDALKQIGHVVLVAENIEPSSVPSDVSDIKGDPATRMSSPKPDRRTQSMPSSQEGDDVMLGVWQRRSRIGQSNIATPDSNSGIPRE